LVVAETPVFGIAVARGSQGRVDFFLFYDVKMLRRSCPSLHRTIEP
jgi:hypothetical protein